MKIQLEYKTLIKSHVFKVLAISVLLSACSGDDSESKEDSLKAQNTSVVLAADSVGSITADSPFNMHKVTLAFPDYSVVEELNYHLGSPYPIIRVSKGVKTIMTINPDKSQEKIYSVIVEDNLIKNSLGHPLGTAYNKVYNYGQTEECQLGTEDMAGKALCYAPKTPNMLYVFNGKGGGSAMPPADVLQGWSLESIIWRPKL